MSKKTIISRPYKKAFKLKVLAKKKENIRRKLVVTAKKLSLKAKQLAVIAKEKESVRRKLVVTDKNLKFKAKQLALTDENLEQIKAKDEAIISSIGDGLMVIDKNSNIVLVNKAFEKILGWKIKEVQGKSLFKIVPTVDSAGKNIAESKRLVTKTLKEHTTTTAIVSYLRKDRSLLPVVLTVSPIIVKGNFIGAVEVFRDVTKEKEIDKAKTEFVSLASHQLRTPLTTVSWYSEMLLAGDVGKLTPDQNKYLEEIYKGNKRMIALVNTLLNVSRLELGTSLVEPEPTDIIALAKNVVVEQKLKIEEKKLIITQKFSTAVPIFSADPKLLRMVFQNLLTNAINYTPEGGKITIEIALSAERSKILIKISDTGYGIPENQQDKIFTKLFRADNVRDKDTEGTGLGLYIVKSIIEDSKGKIWFESEENKGTTFFITLPLKGMKKNKGTKNLS